MLPRIVLAKAWCLSCLNSINFNAAICLRLKFISCFCLEIRWIRWFVVISSEFVGRLPVGGDDLRQKVPNMDGDFEYSYDVLYPVEKITHLSRGEHTQILRIYMHLHYHRGGWTSINHSINPSITQSYFDVFLGMDSYGRCGRLGGWSCGSFARSSFGLVFEGCGVPEIYVCVKLCNYVNMLYAELYLYIIIYSCVHFPLLNRFEGMDVNHHF